MELWYPSDRRGHVQYGDCYQLAVGLKVGYTFTIPKTGDIYRAGFYISSIVDGQDLSCLLENPKIVAAGGGAPPGATDDPYGDCEAGVISGYGTGWNEVEFSVPAEAVVGDKCSLSLKFDSAIGQITLGAAWDYDTPTANGLETSQFPYIYSVIEGFPDPANELVSKWSYFPILALDYGGVSSPDWVYVRGCLPIVGADLFDLYGNASNERGNYIVPTANLIATGIYVIGAINASPPFSVNLYDAAGNVLSTHSNQYAISGASPNLYQYYEFSIDDVSIGPGPGYYLSLKQTGNGPLHPNGDLKLAYYDFDSADIVSAMPESDTIYGVKRPAAGGAWTTETTRRYRIGLICKGGGGAGNYAHSSMI
jgi:hypothetical protein